VNEQQARFNDCVVTGAIDLERDLHAVTSRVDKISRPDCGGSLPQKREKPQMDFGFIHSWLENFPIEAATRVAWK
jgi:hypothetical protein